MNIILLSGGSGKRMWPLSNDIRSKQFLKLFKNEDGEYESMVQRVYRQIKTVDEGANITIATSRTQVSSIHNQLGENVSVCVEPNRRDTFPAIALAAAYLKYEQGVSEEESIVICPVDPYVDDSYYRAVSEVGRLAGENKKNITLMGIEPTYPSEKYGYIIPSDKEDLSDVSEFKEKPDVETAKKYIAKGALWNAGVFAFRLGYILDKAHSLLKFIDYRDLYNHYDECEKISFDYAVAEKEPSIQVLRYAGEWKDVGTWNMMAEVMADEIKGKAMLDSTTRSTNVVNELDIPILVMGAKNMVIAASGDGILIADKEQSSYMKPYVEKISTDVRFAEKSWGSYSVVDAGEGFLTVKVILNPGHRMSYHSHEYRDEVWTVLSGTGKTIIDGMEQIVRPGDVVTMAAGCKHTIIAETELTVLEAQLGENISVNDKKKYQL
ncbi:MAG: cupin domain-containing protein [Lachnospiraceae bacterium]|nr:cupin domain-containing protein [Lachnospiraceae bacterium]